MYPGFDVMFLRDLMQPRHGVSLSAVCLSLSRVSFEGLELHVLNQRLQNAAFYIMVRQSIDTYRPIADSTEVQ